MTSFKAPTSQLVDALKRQLAARSAGYTELGGSLGGLITGQLFELVELLNGMWRTYEWARPAALEALQFASQLAAKGCFSKEQRSAVSKALSTHRSLGHLG